MVNQPTPFASWKDKIVFSPGNPSNFISSHWTKFYIDFSLNNTLLSRKPEEPSCFPLSRHLLFSLLIIAIYLQIKRKQNCSPAFSFAAFRILASFHIVNNWARCQKRQVQSCDDLFIMRLPFSFSTIALTRPYFRFL